LSPPLFPYTTLFRSVSVPPRRYHATSLRPVPAGRSSVRRRDGPTIMITLRVDALAYDVARPYRPVHEVQGGGVNREHIGPFERHPARPELIEARAAALQRLAEQGLWQELVTNRAFTPATAAWQGLVAPELAHAPVPLQRAVADSCEAL